MSSLFSIIVLSLNCEKYIEKCLFSIFTQDFPKNYYEVIVVDGGSRDRTVEIVSKFPRARLIYFPHDRIPQARNRGAKESKGDVLAFIDGDCVADSGWLKNALPYFQGHEASVLGGKVEIPKSSWVERCWSIHRESRGKDRQVVLGNYSPERAARIASYVGAANLFISYPIYNVVGGFHEHLCAGEDSAFCDAVFEHGYRIYYDEKVKVTHLAEPNTLKEFFLQQLWHSKGVTHEFISGKRKKAGYAIYFAIFNFLFLILLPIAGYLCFIQVSLLPLLIVVSFYIFVVSLISISTCVKEKKMCFFGLFVLYALYGLARAINVFPIINMRRKKTHVTQLL